jgi:hypothetical protein
MLKVFEVFEVLGRGESRWSPYKIVRVRWILFDWQLRMFYISHWSIGISYFPGCCSLTAVSILPLKAPHPSTDTIQGAMKVA